MIENKIKPKIQKAINKMPTKVTVLRNTTNEFGEPSVAHVVCEITGLWHDGSNMISQIVTNSGEVKRQKQNFLMVIYDQVSCLIEERDYFELDGEKFEIVDKGNKNKMNIYFDMLVRKC
ncbi:hypothetical protein [Paraclostridium bifermentans]|uniref:hypothetical protein n=1 Tax=Paraclostridium bifermentans TaxID=1490 RepID=UPI001C81D6D8|nr:hypothetical protein [Paraclostridium bifermentans]GIM32711.1 hypothetical protein PAGU1678_19810 [Paraclostridium bifermentans subsp. muricolitidis]